LTKTRVINLYGGPGTGKSTTAAQLFSTLKLMGVNCEYVQEYAKDLAWEHNGNHGFVPLALRASENVFAQQHYRMRRCVGHVDLIVTDSPLLLGLAYIDDKFELPSLRNVIKEAYSLYDNFDVFLNRVKPYNPHGRFQDEQDAKHLDGKIKTILTGHNACHHVVDADKHAADRIVEILNTRWFGTGKSQ